MGSKISHSLEEALAEKPDVVMMLRVQRERMQGTFFPSEREYAAKWSLSGERFKMLGNQTIILHPGPMNRGFEISNEAADDPRSAVLTQVRNGLSVRMAVLYNSWRGGLMQVFKGVFLASGETTDITVEGGNVTKVGKTKESGLDCSGLIALPASSISTPILRQPGYEASETVLSGSPLWSRRWLHGPVCNG